jgi:hypothetical protein
VLSEGEIVAQKVIDAFDALGIGYFIGGSVASAVHGIPRLTMDVDLIADYTESQIAPLVTLLESEFYIDADMMSIALRDRSSSNVIHLATMVKVDIFPRQAAPWPDSEWLRRERKRIGPDEDAPEANIASAEDMILQKLEWYRLTGGRSDRQWGDVQGMLKVQGDRLDFAYLKHWAYELDLSELLTSAYDDAGLTPTA